MSCVTRFVGLDCHQDSVQVCVMNPEGAVLANRSVANDWHAIAKVIEDVTDGELQSTSVRAAIECCSGAAHLAEELMARAGWTVTLAHPGIVTRMKQNPDKSDKADAYILADLMRLGYLPKVWLAPDEIRQLRSLVRFRVVGAGCVGTALSVIRLSLDGDSQQALQQGADFLGELPRRRSAG